MSKKESQDQPKRTRLSRVDYAYFALLITAVVMSSLAIAKFVRNYPTFISYKSANEQQDTDTTLSDERNSHMAEAEYEDEYETEYVADDEGFEDDWEFDGYRDDSDLDEISVYVADQIIAPLPESLPADAKNGKKMLKRNRPPSVE